MCCISCSYKSVMSDFLTAQNMWIVLLKLYEPLIKLFFFFDPVQWFQSKPLWGPSHQDSIRRNRTWILHKFQGVCYLYFLFVSVFFLYVWWCNFLQTDEYQGGCAHMNICAFLCLGTESRLLCGQQSGAEGQFTLCSCHRQSFRFCSGCLLTQCKCEPCVTGGKIFCLNHQEKNVA